MILWVGNTCTWFSIQSLRKGTVWTVTFFPPLLPWHLLHPPQGPPPLPVSTVSFQIYTVQTQFSVKVPLIRMYNKVPSLFPATCCSLNLWNPRSGVLFPAQALSQALSLKCSPISSTESQEGSFSNLWSSAWLLCLVLVRCFQVTASNCWAVVVEAALMRQRRALKRQLEMGVKAAKIHYPKKEFCYFPLQSGKNVFW